MNREAKLKRPSRVACSDLLDLCVKTGMCMSGTSEILAFERVLKLLRRSLSKLDKWFLVELHVAGGTLKLARLKPRTRLCVTLAALGATRGDYNVPARSLRVRQDFMVEASKQLYAKPALKRKENRRRIYLPVPSGAPRASQG